ncbi:MAG: pyrroline-5-carboxylate reductase [Pseudomonadota bacterium]
MSLDAVKTRGLVLLGCGKMGSAMLEGWLASGIPARVVTVIDPYPSARLEELTSDGLILNGDLPNGPAVCVLAVKPQMMAEALPQIGDLAGPDTLFVSIAAGTSIEYFEAVLGQQAAIVRAMPNTPAAIGRGITALVGNEASSDKDLALAEALLTAIGQTVRLEDEGQMDAVTAVSGSGPAYVFNLIETMAAAGAAEGLPEDLAMRLAIATVDGAGALAAQSSQSAEQLRINVTSPAGTTAAALEVLMAEDGLAPLMQRAVAAAADRSRALGS